MRTAGFVLAGGNSSRMGRDKAKLPVASGSLVEAIAQKVKEAASTVSLVGPAARYRDLKIECIEDLRPALGPLAGIETALASRRAECNLIVACDMPNVEAVWLAHLIAEAQRSGARCLISKDAAGRIHPLCSVWTYECLPFVQHALDENRLRLLDLLAEINAGYLTSSDRLLNINTPQEWAAWQLTH